MPAAGRGERLGVGVAKAFVPLVGEALLVHAVRGIFAAGCVDAVIVAAPPRDVQRAVDLLAPFREDVTLCPTYRDDVTSSPVGERVRVVAGGASRTESVRLALEHAEQVLPGIQAVLVHDAARALTPPDVFNAVARAVLAGAGAVVPVLPLVDTVKRVDDRGRVVSTVDRSSLCSVQTPQGFAPGVLRRAHATGLGELTDDAGLVEALGEPVCTVPGDPRAFKVTTPFDLELAERLLTA